MTNSASGPSVLGGLLRSAAALPRSASTDMLGTQAFVQLNARALQSPELRQGLAAWAASVRHPEDEEARAEDAAQWEALLSETLVQQLLTGEALTPEQRLGNVAFLLAWPEPRLDLLRTYEGDLTRCAAHELLLAMQAVDASQVAPIVAVPEAIWKHLPELTAARPDNAQGLAALLPDTLAPSRFADVLAQLADGFEDPLAQGLAALFAVAPGAKASLETLVGAATAGLRTLASGIRAEPEDVQRAAQSLVLGAAQHQTLTRNLLALVEALLASHRGDAAALRLAEQARRGMAASGAEFAGRMLASDVGAAVAGMLSRATEARWNARLASGRLPLGEPVLRAQGFSPVGLAAGPLADAVGELLSLYTSQLGDLGEEAFALLGEDLVARLTSGQRAGLAEAWGAWLQDLARMAALQDADPDVRAEVLRALVVGGVTGVLAWDVVAPQLHARGPVFFGRGLAVDTTQASLPDVYRASAALAVTVLADAFLLEDLGAGVLTPEQALAQARERGESLLVDALAPVDSGLASALLSAMVGSTEA